MVCRLAKGQPVKFISHLDWMRAIARALRRARLPVAYSAGYNPHPRLAYGPPLSVGNTSETELVAATLTEAVDPGTFQERLAAALPPGIRVLAAWPAPLLGGKVTFGELDTVVYLVTVWGPVDQEALNTKVSQIMEAEQLPYRRLRVGKVKEFDARPLVRLVQVVEASESSAVLKLTLRLGPSGTLRPEEMLDLLGLAATCHAQVHRTALYTAKTPTPGRPRPTRLLGGARRRR